MGLSGCSSATAVGIGGTNTPRRSLHMPAQKSIQLNGRVTARAASLSEPMGFPMALMDADHIVLHVKMLIGVMDIIVAVSASNRR